MIETSAAAGSSFRYSVSVIASFAARWNARVDRRVDAQAARLDGLDAVLGDQLVADVAEEVRLADLRVQPAGLQVQAPVAERGLVAEDRDVAVLVQRLQHGGPALERVVGVEDRVVERRRLRQAGEQGRLHQRQVLRRLREVRLRRRLDAVGVVAEVDLVHPRGQDPVLRPVPAELDREAGLLDLPLEGPLARDVEVADELLRDRRAALDDAALRHVATRGAEDPLVVDAAVLVEAPVLDGDRRLRHPRADLGERHRLPVALGRDRAEQRAVGGVDERVLADRHRLERRERAAVLERRKRAEPGEDKHERDPEEDDQHDGDRVPPAVPAAADPRPSPPRAVRQLVEGIRPARHQAKIPAARSRWCTRSRSSCSSRSASVGSVARRAR